MTIFLDNRAGSAGLKSYLQYAGAPEVCTGRWPSDIEFIGQGPDSQPLVISIEYKTITDCLDAMTTGRLTGTQLPTMAAGRRYLLIEGAMRVSDDGILEIKSYHPQKRQYYWGAAHGRAGEGWTAREFFSRLASLEEFWGVRVRHTFNERESAAWVVSLYRWWQKPYEEHSSYRQWDQSQDSGPALNPASILLPTSKLPTVQRMAREIANVGQLKAGYVGLHFKTPAAMIIADEAEWLKVSWQEKLKKGGTRLKHFSKDTIRKILRELWEGVVE